MWRKLYVEVKTVSKKAGLIGNAILPACSHILRFHVEVTFYKNL